MHDDVGAERERLLQVRRGERVVDDDTRVARVRELARPRRCRRSTAPGWSASRSTPAGSRRATRAASASRSPRSTAVHVDAVALVHARDEPERAAVRVGRDDHVVAGIERAQDRVLGREAAREREAVPRAFERREARLERVARRVAAARVLVAPVLADRVLRERRREADRRDDRAGGRDRAPGPRGSRASRSRGRCSGSRHGDRRARRGTRARRSASSTPIGWPPSSTSTDGPCSRHSTTRATGSPIPIIGIGALHDVADRTVEHAAVAEREVHQLELAQRADDLLGRERQLLGDADDELRHAGVVHQRDRVAHRLVGQ